MKMENYQLSRSEETASKLFNLKKAEIYGNRGELTDQFFRRKEKGKWIAFYTEKDAYLDLLANIFQSLIAEARMIKLVFWWMQET